MFPDVKYEMCRTDPKLAPICDRLRDAARSGDPNECAGTGDEETSCRAALTLDKSLCVKAKDKYGCEKAIDANLVFAKGLKALAESGPPREQAFAKAALGDPDACAPFAKVAVTSCPGLTSTSVRSPVAVTTSVPAPSRRAPAPK
jgi:hypothetical protein